MIHLDNGSLGSPRQRLGGKREKEEDRRALISGPEPSRIEEIVVRPPSMGPSSRDGVGEEGRAFRASSMEAMPENIDLAQKEKEEKPDVHLEKFQDVNMNPERLQEDGSFDELDLEEAATDLPPEEDEDEMREVPRRIDCSWLLSWAIAFAQFCQRQLVCSRPKFLQMVRELDAIPEDEYSGARKGCLRVYAVVFESSTIAGQIFDITFIILIIASVLTVVLDSVESVRETTGDTFLALEALFTTLFSIEYMVRLLCIKNPLEYFLSYLGIIDLLAVGPSYLDLAVLINRSCVLLSSFLTALVGFWPNAKYSMVIRVVRVLRVFRVLKLVNYVNEFSSMIAHLKANQKRVFIFLFWICCINCIIGCLMYIIEDGRHGFSSIPESVYWAVVTITTVGYGDIAPKTSLGQFIASLVMLFGYGIIACPFVLYGTDKHDYYNKNPLKKCAQCRRAGHQSDARFCRLCGFPLEDVNGKPIQNVDHYEKAAQYTPKTEDYRSPRAGSRLKLATPRPKGIYVLPETLTYTERK